MTTAPVQRSFADGELAPEMYARTDSLRYIRGLRTCRNMIVQRAGGASNRPGLVYLNAAKDSTVACRLVPFIKDATDDALAYVLEFGDGYIRFYQGAARVLTSGVSTWANGTAYAIGDLVTQGGATYYCKVAHTSANGTDKPGTDAGAATKWYAQTTSGSVSIYEIPTPYVTADLAAIDYDQDGDVITLTHRSYAVRELRRYTSTKWVLSAVSFGPAIAAPANVSATGGAAGDDTYYAVTAIMDGTLEESLAGTYTLSGFAPSSSNTVAVTWNNVAGALSYNVYRGVDGHTYALIKSAGGVQIAQSDTSWTDNDEIASSAATGAYVPAAGQCRNPMAAISATNRAFDGKYTIACRTTLSSGAASSGLTRGRVAVYYLRSTDAARVLAAYFYVDPVTGASQTSGPLAASFQITVPDDGYTSLQIDLVPEVKPAAGGSSCSLEVSTASAPDNAVAYTQNANTFTDDGDTGDDAQGPPSQQALFTAADTYPAANVGFQQRRFLGSTSNGPAKVWGSRVGSAASFALSTPLQDDDRIAFTLKGKRSQTVKHLLDLSGLVVFTSGAVFLLTGNDANVLTPDSLVPKEIDENGCSALRPLRVDKSALYVQARGTAVRDLVPVQAPASLGSYEGNELSIFATHLFQGYTIDDWAYAKQPFGVVWCVRSDGALLGLTYIREFGMWGWHRHDTDGVVENVCVVPEGAEDAVYCVVNRTINGTTARYIERLASRLYSDIRDAVFMDCALTVDGRHTGTTTMTLSGGTNWDDEEQLTLTASASTFTSGDVGNWIYLYDEDGALAVRLSIEAYSGIQVVTVRPDRDVPAAMQGAAVGNGSLGTWGRAITTITGLSHLEGEEVAVLGDGFVLASPNNYTVSLADGSVTRTYAAVTVASGQITLSQPAVVIQVGLPYIADLETLDLDGPGSRADREAKKLVTGVGLFLKDSRGVLAGRPDKVSDDAPRAGLDEMKPRESEGYDDPPALVTDWRKIDISEDWNSNGRVLVRQLDPLPMTVLSISPIGYGA